MLITDTPGRPHATCSAGFPALLLMVVLLGGGCFDDVSPPGTRRVSDADIAPTAPAGSTRTTVPDADAAWVEFGPIRAPRPRHWIWSPPTSRMRLANYIVPADSGGRQAELVIFHGIGGSDEDNINRWQGQFADGDGNRVAPLVTMLRAGSTDITMIELAGSYMGMSMPAPIPGQLFLAAIIHAPGGTFHARLLGDRTTVEAHRAAFHAFLSGIESVPGP